MAGTAAKNKQMPKMLVLELVLIRPDGRKEDVVFDEYDTYPFHNELLQPPSSNQRDSLFYMSDMTLLGAKPAQKTSLKDGGKGFRSDLEFVVEAPGENEDTPTSNTNQEVQEIDFEEPRHDFLTWQQVVCTFLLFFNTWGLMNSFGEYQQFYEAVYGQQGSRLNISRWIGSSQGCLHLIVGVFTHQLYDKGYCRWLLAGGSVLVILGMLITSFLGGSSELFPGVIFTQGVVVGVGSGLLFGPSVTVLPTYFSQHHGVLVGALAMSGSYIGGIVYAIIFAFLEPILGFGWTTRATTLLVCLSLVFPVIFLKPRDIAPTRHQIFFDHSSLKDTPFLLLLIGQFFAFMGLYVPFFYLQIWEKSCNNFGTTRMEPYILPLLNLAALLGLTASNSLSNWFGALNTTTVSLYILGAIGLCWTPVSFPSFAVVFCCIFGFFAGIVLALLSDTICAISLRDLVAPRIGMSAVMAGLGLLVGYPISQYLNLGGQQCFGMTEVFCGVTLVGAAILLTVARCMKLGKVWGRV